MANSRWTRTETLLAKETLKLTNGNQTKAAVALWEQLDRSLASIKIKMCSLAKAHPSLRKANIAKRVNKRENVETKIVKSIKLTGNKLVISFQ